MTSTWTLLTAIGAIALAAGLCWAVVAYAVRREHERRDGPGRRG